MASTPDQNPDSIPDEAADAPEQVSSESHRDKGVEDSPGTDGGTAGTGDGSGQILVQDQEFER